MNAQTRASIVTALEALEVCDYGLVADLLLDALENDPAPAGVSCPHCERRFAWPGLMDEHRRRAHAHLPSPTPPPRRALRLIPGGRR